MILGEVEYTVHQDASGAYCAEGTPGATTTRCVAGAACWGSTRSCGCCIAAVRSGLARAGAAACPLTERPCLLPRPLRLDPSEVEAAGGGGFVLKEDPSVKARFAGRWRGRKAGLVVR